MKEITAFFYDGHTPRRQAAQLQVVGDEVVAWGEFGHKRALRTEVEISEPMGRSPRFVRFGDGSTFEVADLDGFAQWLQIAGWKDAPVVHLHKRWSWALGSLLAAALLIAAIYLWALPALGKVLAPAIPAPVVQMLSQQTLEFLDQRLLEPSRLSEARRAQLTDQANRVLRVGTNVPSYRLHFRSSRLGPNAFALPNGDLVIFDQLVELADNDDQVVGVIAHEVGHVAQLHGLRQLIQASVISFAAAFYLGDISSLTAGLGALVLESRYSREFEFEADAYAAHLMLSAGRSTEPLAVMLERLEKATTRGKAPASAWSLLSSHPDTAERVERLRTMR